MANLDKLAWEILNATGDDWENLEQLYQLICFDFSPEAYEERERGAYYLRPSPGAPSLEALADHIADLVDSGFLAARQAESGEAVTDLTDRRYVWRAWFQMTPAGRSAWASSVYANLLEQEQRS